jgi:hypothetical protein
MASENGKAKVGPKDDRTFPSAEAARAAGRLPGCEGWRLWEVRGPGGAVYAWANGIGMALRRAALAAGFSASCLDRAVSKEQLAAGLAALSPEDRAILIAQYVPAPAGKKGK